MSYKKYYSKKSEAVKACEERNKTASGYQVFKMPKGTRHHGEYAVCTELEFLNTY